MSEFFKGKHGASIQRIFFARSEPGEQPYIDARDGVSLTLIYDYLGDHAEVFVREHDGEKDLRCHNIRALETIVWSET